MNVLEGAIEGVSRDSQRAAIRLDALKVQPELGDSRTFVDRS